jgi:hypothetical protein
LAETLETKGRTTGLSILIVAMAAFDLLVLGAMHLLRPEVDAVTEATSSYAVGSFGFLATAATFAVAVGALGLAFLLRKAVATVSRLGVGLLTLFGVCKLIQVFFPIDVEPDLVTTTAGSIHNIVGNIAFFSLPVAAVLVARSLRRPAVILSWLLVLSAVAVLTSGFAGGFGVAQRVFLVLSSSWMLVAALDVRPFLSRSDKSELPEQPAQRLPS